MLTAVETGIARSGGVTGCSSAYRVYAVSKASLITVSGFILYLFVSLTLIITTIAPSHFLFKQILNHYTIKDLLGDLNLSTQTIVAKQNGELTIEENVINDGDEIKLIQIIYGG